MDENKHKQIDQDPRIKAFPGSYAAFSDVKLVEMVQAGDERAFETLMRRYESVVTGYLWGKMWERDEIADLVQEIFLRAYTKIEQLRDGARFNQWVLGIARRAWADYCRHPSTQRKKQHVALDDMDVSKGNELVDSGIDPAASAGDREFHEVVQSAIGALKERYRLILYLRLIEEKSNTDIAQLTGLKENAVRTRFSRGLEQLRKLLVKRGLVDF